MLRASPIPAAGAEFRGFLHDQRELSGSEGSMPESEWGSYDGTPWESDVRIPRIDLGALDQVLTAGAGAGGGPAWKDDKAWEQDSDLSEGEVAMEPGGGHEYTAGGAAGIYPTDYRSEGETGALSSGAE